MVLQGTLLLMKKSWIQDKRRLKGLACEMLLPILVFLLCALIRVSIDAREVPNTYGDSDPYTARLPIAYDYRFQSSNVSSLHYETVAKLICLSTDPERRSADLEFHPAGYLAIIPSPNNHANLQAIIDALGTAWQKGKQAWNANGAQTQCSDPWTQFQCRTACRYEALNFTEGSILKYFDSEQDMDAYLGSDKYVSQSWDPTDTNSDQTRPISMAIVFNEHDDWSSMSYTLRTNATFLPTTDGDVVNLFEKDFWSLFSGGYDKYVTYGVVELQQWLNQVITEKVAVEAGASASPSFQFGIYVMPVAGYLTDDFFAIISDMLPFLMILAFIYPYFVITGSVVDEKANKIKEGLRMMGASTTSYWLSLYLYRALKLVVISFLCTFVASITSVFKYSSSVVIFVWFTLFCFTLLCSAVLFSTFFDNAKVASMVSTIFLLTLYFLSAAGDAMTTSSQKTALCLSGPACFAMSSVNVAKYEEGLIGVGWDTMGEEYMHLRFDTVLLMLFVDCIIYILLALYFDRVIPSKYGQTFPFYFVFQPSFWFPNREYAAIEPDGADGEFGDKYEHVGDDQTRSLRIRNLRKVFSVGFNAEPFVAVNGISLDMYEDEIFCLLGHNGAGKTTTLGMLSGMINITSGSATIRGKDVMRDMVQIRQSLGVCPQHDVLWPALTVEEHLRLFAQLKGVSKANVQQEVDKMIDAVKMEEKRKKYPTQLSGGQKRKLSLGIALIGGSRVVFLDEPTSGMDPHSRRDAWQLIRNSAKGRTIILTTHFMDEADILSDRIAIMAHGQIKCCGSSLFLKRLYGVGYSCTISLDPDISVSSVEAHVSDLVETNVETAQLLSSYGAELIYRLPFESSRSFPNLFRAIDAQQGELHINSYGISVTTLEEVFIKVGQGEHTTDDMSDEVRDLKDTIKERRNSRDDVSEEQQDAYLDAVRQRSQQNLFFTHLYAMLYKKWNYTKRDRRALLCQLVLPVIFMILGFAVVDIAPPDNYPRLQLDMTQFDGTANHKIPYNTESTTSTNPFPALWTHMQTKYGSLQAMEGGDNGKPYEYDASTGHSLRTFGDAMLAVSDQKPYRYVSLYFPTVNGSNWKDSVSVIDATRHIGIGANLSAFHSLPVAVSIANNLALKQISSTAHIDAYIQSLPTTEKQAARSQQIEAIIYSTYLSFGLAFFPAAVMFNIVSEKENLSKLQLLVSGINSVAYWLGNFIFDAATIVPSCLSAIALVYAFDATSFTGDALGAFFLILFLYGISIVPFTYLFSWLFKSATRAQYIGLISFIFLGYGFSLATFILDVFPSTRDASKIVKTIVRFSPSYCSARALLNLAAINLPVGGGWEPNDPPFTWEVTGRLLTYMAWESVLYFALTVLVEYLSTIPSVNALLGLVSNMPKTAMELDSDVEAEQNKLKQFTTPSQQDEYANFDFEQCSDPVILTGLRKVYNTGSALKNLLHGVKEENCVVAVQDLWYSVPRGQIFGFLGVNGAGKTTTLSMLCGKYSPSEGTAYINKVPISDQITCRRMIGYCPQFDAIIDLLTAREHLMVYGLIKGLSSAEIKAQAQSLIDSLGLELYADKAAGAYSGGNKRKLSVAMAMIGEPPIVFLDEPSTGMDPVSKRGMWNFVSANMKDRSVILTTHSMEECEALCHRIGIMVKGQLRCIGSAQRLKQRYGKGYQLDCNLRVDKHELLTDELRQVFGDCVEVVEKQSENIRYTIANSEQMKLSTADMFEAMEKIKQKIGVDGYALSQTTLEQIFIQMAGNNDQDSAVDEEPSQVVVENKD